MLYLHNNEMKDLDEKSYDGWIPVGEKLPEVKHGFAYRCLVTVYCHESQKNYTEYYVFDGKFPPYVIAWQPLPAPYKG